MGFNPRHFLQMSLWARRPPSQRRVILVLAVIALCVLVALAEWLFGWPEALRPATVPKGRL